MCFISAVKDDVEQHHEVSPMAEAEPLSLSSRFWRCLTAGSLAFTGVVLGSWLSGYRPDRPLCVGLTVMLAISGASLL